MDKRQLQQNERRIWEAVRDAAPMAEAIQLISPWNKAFGSLQVPVGIHGDGLLSWIPDSRLPKIRAIAAGLVYGDQVQLLLVHNESVTIPVDLTLLVRSSWSRAGIPLTQARQWPEEVVIGTQEERAALSGEADYLCLWIEGKLIAFRADEYRRSEIEAMEQRLREPAFQRAYFTPGGLHDLCPRHARSYGCKKAVKPFFVMHRSKDAAELTRRPVRLFKDHWVFEVLNPNNAISNVFDDALDTKESTWELSPTSPNTAPDGQ